MIKKIVLSAAVSMVFLTNSSYALGVESSYGTPLSYFSKSDNGTSQVRIQDSGVSMGII